MTRNLDENVAYAAAQVITGAHAAKIKTTGLEDRSEDGASVLLLPFICNSTGLEDSSKDDASVLPLPFI